MEAGARVALLVSGAAPLVALAVLIRRRDLAEARTPAAVIGY